MRPSCERDIMKIQFFLGIFTLLLTISLGFHLNGERYCNGNSKAPPYLPGNVNSRVYSTSNQTNEAPIKIIKETVADDLNE